MNAPTRRGACPRLSAPMQTGDGLLARLIPSGATISLDAFAKLAEAAQRHGNGTIEVTSRGSIQVRGLSAATAPAFAAEVEALGIDCGDAIPVLTHPLSGLEADESCDISALAGALRPALAEAPFAPRLSAKVSVILDGGGALHLDGLSADVRLHCHADGICEVALGGDHATARPLGAVAAEHAVECAVALLDALARRAPHARMKALIGSGETSLFADAIANRLVACRHPFRPRQPAQPIGVHALREGRVAVGLGMPFGHSDARTLGELMKLALQHAASGVRTAPDRVLLLVGLPRANAGRLAADASALGFIADPGDPRRRVVACPGSPVCASGQIPARALAPDVAEAAAPHLGRGDIVHVSGCDKGCAHPSPAALTIVGADGMCHVRVDGGASRTVTVDKLPQRIVPLLKAREAERA